MAEGTAVDTKKVFVVHGRNLQARDDMFTFLRAIDLRPIEWGEALALTGEGSPYIGDVIETAFHKAQAVVVLFTPDDMARLRSEYAGSDDDDEVNAHPQPRPNVLFEAGMAFGTHPSRTILVELGRIHHFTDVIGRHAVRMDGSIQRKHELIGKLQTAGCELNSGGTDWMRDGLLVPPVFSDGDLPPGKRLPVPDRETLALAARYAASGKDGVLIVSNRGATELYDIRVEFPEGETHPIVGLPIERLPSGRSTKLPMLRYIGEGSNRFDVELVARTKDGEEVRVTEFIDLS